MVRTVSKCPFYLLLSSVVVTLLFLSSSWCGCVLFLSSDVVLGVVRLVLCGAAISGMVLVVGPSFGCPRVDVVVVPVVWGAVLQLPAASSASSRTAMILGGGGPPPH